MRRLLALGLLGLLLMSCGDGGDNGARCELTSLCTALRLTNVLHTALGYPLVPLPEECAEC